MEHNHSEPTQFEISTIPPPPPPGEEHEIVANHHNHNPENFDALLMDSGKSPESDSPQSDSQVLSKGFFDGIALPTLPTVDPYSITDSVLFQPALYLFKVSLLPVNLATSLISPDEDKALEYAAALAIQNMKKFPALISSSTLLIAALKLFDELRLNSLRPLFKKRIQQIIVFIGQVSGGLHNYSIQYKKVFTAEHLHKLENHIFIKQWYFLRNLLVMISCNIHFVEKNLK